MIPPQLIDRFRADLERLTGEPPGELGLAVSGGPDSVALLQLAAAAYPGRVAAATVEHGLRPEGAAEAAMVARLCAWLGVPHAILPLSWDPPSANIQAKARDARYAALATWARDRSIRFVATAHHLDDQAETLLLRLARGSGIAGLAGTRPVRPVVAGDETCQVVRPLLGWRKAELARIVANAGAETVEDPSNRDDRFDRTRARGLLAGIDWPRPERLAASASHLRDGETALAWMAARVFAERSRRDDRQRLAIDVVDLPRELQRRLLAHALGVYCDPEAIPGPKLTSLLDRLQAGEAGTLAGVKAEPGPPWTFEPAPPHRA